MCIDISYLAHTTIVSPIFGLAIHRQDGLHITGPNTRFSGVKLPTVEGKGNIIFRIPNLSLLEGKYSLSIAATNWSDTEMFDYHDRVYPFRVVNLDEEITEKYGLMTLNGHWELVGGS